MPSQTLLLPPLARLDDVEGLPRLLGRADVLPARPAGLLPALADAFALPAGGLPAAALLREAAVHDAGGSVWLCADPVYVRPDANGARLLAWGEMALAAEESEELARPLRPVLGDTGMLLEISAPSRWQLRLREGTPLPAFATPEQVLGQSLLMHLPQGAQGRRWRALFNELQILLHQHPRNRARIAAGLPPINALWFWGGGALPARPRTRLTALLSEDAVARALALHAQVALIDDPAQAAGTGALWLDLAAADAPCVSAHLAEAMRRMRRGDSLELAFLDGRRWRVTSGQRWRFWRRAWQR